MSQQNTTTPPPPAFCSNRRLREGVSEKLFPFSFFPFAIVFPKTELSVMHNALTIDSTFTQAHLQIVFPLTAQGVCGRTVLFFFWGCMWVEKSKLGGYPATITHHLFRFGDGRHSSTASSSNAMQTATTQWPTWVTSGLVDPTSSRQPQYCKESLR